MNKEPKAVFAFDLKRSTPSSFKDCHVVETRPALPGVDYADFTSQGYELMVAKYVGSSRYLVEFRRSEEDWVNALGDSFPQAVENARTHLYREGKLRSTHNPASPQDIRAQGWMVAVHNDYRLDGQNHTFWLFTKDDRCVKGEGRSDAEALNQVRVELLRRQVHAVAAKAAEIGVGGVVIAHPHQPGDPA